MEGLTAMQSNKVICTVMNDFQDGLLSQKSKMQNDYNTQLKLKENKVSFFYEFPP